MTKNEARQRRKIRIRKKISGTAERPRLVLFRSNLHMYAQVVDDLTGATLAATSTLVLSKGGEKVKFTIPYVVTSPDFVRINGVPYLTSEETEGL